MTAQSDHTPDNAADTILRDALVSGDALLSSVAPILSHLVATPDNTLFNDQVVASIRARAAHVASQLLTAQGEAQPSGDVAGFVAAAKDGLAAHLLRTPAFLVYCHALTIEAQLALSLEKRSGLDPVLPPFVQEAVAAGDAELASAAMAALTAQARFMQYHRRMALPVVELPANVLDAIIDNWHNFAGANARNALAQAEMKLRATRDEVTARTVLMDRLLERHERPEAALSLSHAGVSMFACALANATSQLRDRTVLAMTEQQAARLAVSLRAAGLPEKGVAQQFAFLRPDRSAPEGIGSLRRETARGLLRALPVQAGDT